MSSQIDILSSDITNLSDYMALVNIVGWPHTAKDIFSLLILGRPWRAVDRESQEVIGVAVWWPMGRDWGRVGLVIVVCFSLDFGRINFLPALALAKSNVSCFF